MNYLREDMNETIKILFKIVFIQTPAKKPTTNNDEKKSK